MNDIKAISDADKLGFIASLHAVSEWSHSVNRHNGFWEEIEELYMLDSNESEAFWKRALVQIALGRIALIHSEQSEAVEAVRKHDPATWSSTEKDSFVSEMAGTVVRIMDLCEWLGVPLAEAIVAEINRNETRGYKHGGKAA